MLKLQNRLFLLLLVTLSILLTFSIWTYSPPFKSIEQSPSVNISIGAKKKVDEIVKPYKVVFNFEDELKGTTDSDKIDRIMDEVTAWEIADIKPISRQV